MSRSPKPPTGPALDLLGLALAPRDGAHRLHPVDLAIQPGELITLVGPSGAGKTTLLRLIAGLDAPSNGTLRLDGHDQTHIPPHRRGAALLFQEPVVYPHLSVRANLAFSALARGIPESELTARLHRLADRLGLSPLLDRPPARLSGGERQRVAIGRVLLSGARLLLLDEPFARLDVHLRDGVAAAVRDWHRQHALTTLLVTHDPAEAARLADRVGVLEQGKLVAFGPPQALYEHPTTPTVGRLVGTPAMEFLHVRITSKTMTLSSGEMNPIQPAGEPVDPLVLGAAGRLRPVSSHAKQDTAGKPPVPPNRIHANKITISHVNQNRVHPIPDLSLSDGNYLVGYRPIAPVIVVAPPDSSPQPDCLDLGVELVAVEPLGRDRRCVYKAIGADQPLVVIEPDDRPSFPAHRNTLRLDLRAVSWFPQSGDAQTGDQSDNQT